MRIDEPTTMAEHIFQRKLFDLGGKPVSLATLFVVTTILVGAWLFSKAIQLVVHRGFVRRGVGDRGAVQTVERLLNYAILVIAFIVALQTAGIDLGALVAATAVFAVGIGFAMQGIVLNFVSGIVLLLERSIKIDDVIEVDGKIVRVMDMGIRSTRVRTLFEEDIILPNSFLVQQPIKNLTLHDSLIRVAVHVGVSYSSDLAVVRRILEKVVSEVPDTDAQYPPRVLLEEFASSAVSYEVSVWTHDPWNHRLTRSAMREAIWAAFKKEGVVIAFPQVDVHFDKDVMGTLKKIAA